MYSYYINKSNRYISYYIIGTQLKDKLRQWCHGSSKYVALKISDRWVTLLSLIFGYAIWSDDQVDANNRSE